MNARGVFNHVLQTDHKLGAVTNVNPSESGRGKCLDAESIKYIIH